MNQEERQPGRAELRTGETAGHGPPKNVFLGDEAARYMQKHAEESFAKRHERSELPPIDGPVDRPPFRRSRLRRYSELLSRKAEALIERGTIEILTNGEPLHAQLHMFSDGTGVFEYEFRAPYGGGGGATRIDKGKLTSELVAWCLEQSLLNSRVRPIADQEI